MVVSVGTQIGLGVIVSKYPKLSVKWCPSFSVVVQHPVCCQTQTRHKELSILGILSSSRPSAMVVVIRVVVTNIKELV